MEQITVTQNENLKTLFLSFINDEFNDDRGLELFKEFTSDMRQPWNWFSSYLYKYHNQLGFKTSFICYNNDTFIYYKKWLEILFFYFLVQGFISSKLTWDLAKRGECESEELLYNEFIKPMFFAKLKQHSIKPRTLSLSYLDFLKDKVNPYYASNEYYFRIKDEIMEHKMKANRRNTIFGVSMISLFVLILFFAIKVFLQN